MQAHDCMCRESRMFSYEHAGHVRWVAVPVCQSLQQPGGPKNVTVFEDGETGIGKLILDEIVVEKLLTCVEP